MQSSVISAGLSFRMMQNLLYSFIHIIVEVYDLIRGWCGNHVNGLYVHVLTGNISLYNIHGTGGLLFPAVDCCIFVGVSGGTRFYFMQTLCGYNDVTFSSSLLIAAGSRLFDEHSDIVFMSVNVSCEQGGYNVDLCLLIVVFRDPLILVRHI